MPPWQAEDGFGDFKNGHALAAHEMDMILEWSGGGYPQGPRDLSARTTCWLPTHGRWVSRRPHASARRNRLCIGASTNDVVRYFVVSFGNE